MLPILGHKSRKMGAAKNTVKRRCFWWSAAGAAASSGPPGPLAGFKRLRATAGQGPMLRWYGSSWEQDLKAMLPRTRPAPGPAGPWPDLSAYARQGSLEVKLPTIWTDEKQRWEESEKRREEERNSKRESLRRKKIQMREKVGKSRTAVFFQWFVAREGRKVGSLKRWVRSRWRWTPAPFAATVPSVLAPVDVAFVALVAFVVCRCHFLLLMAVTVAASVVVVLVVVAIVVIVAVRLVVTDR